MHKTVSSVLCCGNTCVAWRVVLGASGTSGNECHQHETARGVEGVVPACTGKVIAKKMWHRGHQGKARDLFDLCAVADAEPEAIGIAAPFMLRHGAAFLHQLKARAALREAEFEAIDALKFQRPFSQCLEQARSIIEPLVKAQISR